MSGQETFYGLAATLMPVLLFAALTAWPKMATSHRGGLGPAAAAVAIIVVSAFAEALAIGSAVVGSPTTITRDIVVAAVICGMSGAGLVAAWPIVGRVADQRKRFLLVFGATAFAVMCTVLSLSAFGLRATEERAQKALAEAERAEAIQRKGTDEWFRAERLRNLSEHQHGLARTVTIGEAQIAESRASGDTEEAKRVQREAVAAER